MLPLGQFAGALGILFGLLPGGGLVIGQLLLQVGNGAFVGRHRIAQGLGQLGFLLQLILGLLELLLHIRHLGDTVQIQPQGPKQADCQQNQKRLDVHKISLR